MAQGTGLTVRMQRVAWLAMAGATVAACGGAARPRPVVNTGEGSRVSVRCEIPCGNPSVLVAAAESAVAVVERTTRQRIGSIGTVFIHNLTSHAAASARLRRRADSTRAFASTPQMEAHVPLELNVDTSMRVPSHTIRTVAHEATHLAVYAAGASRLPFWMREGFPQYVAARVGRQLGYIADPAEDPWMGSQFVIMREETVSLNAPLFAALWIREPVTDDSRAYATAAVLYEWLAAEHPALTDSLWRASLLRPPVPVPSTVIGRLLRAQLSYEAFRSYVNRAPVGWHEVRRHLALRPDTVQQGVVGDALAWRWPRERAPYRLSVEAVIVRGQPAVVLSAPPNDYIITLIGGGYAAILRSDATTRVARSVAITPRPLVGDASRLAFVVEVDTGRVRARIGGATLEVEDPRVGASTRWGLRVSARGVVRWTGLSIEALPQR